MNSLDLSLIITNMSSKCSFEVFYKTYVSILPLLDAGCELIIVDDSGVDNIPKNYYNNLKCITVFNSVNINSLHSRYVGSLRATKNWLRFVDAGDILLNCNQFIHEFNILPSDVDLVIFNQVRKSDGTRYYSCTGDTGNLDRVRLSALGGFLGSTVWSKLFKTSIFVNSLTRYLGKTESIFHLDDYYTLNLYLKYCTNKVITFNNDYIEYDDLNGDSVASTDIKYNESTYIKNKLIEIFEDSKDTNLDVDLCKKLISLRVDSYLNK